MGGGRCMGVNGMWGSDVDRRLVIRGWADEV